MRIYVRNLPKKIPKKLVEEAINFYSSKLLSKGICDNIIIFLRYKHYARKYKNHLGFCEAQLGYSPRIFYITMCAPLTRNTFLEILGHEMVHVKQFARNELRFYDGKRCKIARFQKKIYSKEEPWEEEPEKKAPILCQAFMRKKNVRSLGHKILKTS